MTFRDGILSGFEPRFQSIGKDKDRYFDALVNLSEQGVLEPGEVIQRSGEGALWITFQYIEKGLLDLVETDLKRTVTSRDSYGRLFENTRLTLDRLLETSETDRVKSIYRAAIKHRLKAMKEEAAHWKTVRGTHSSTAKSKWMRHNLSPLKDMIKDYKRVLSACHQTDPEIVRFDASVKACEVIQNGGN